MAANPSELSEVLADLQRHLAWQETDAGPVVLADADALKAQAAASNQARSASPPATPVSRMTPAAAPMSRAADAPASRPTATPANRSAPAPAAPLPSRLTGASSRPLAAETPSRPLAADASLKSGPAQAATSPNARRAKTVADLPKISAYADSDRRPLDEIKRELGDCTRCKLCSGRKQIVFGVGNPRAKLVFVGEGPGADEDAQGIPFVGAAGQLLTKMIEAMGFSRDEVYICNVVKCRPPDNRTPEIDEIESCEPFLRAQLGAIQPEVIVALGKTAVQTLLREEAPITKIRGSWREYAGIRVMPTFHPSYLLRKPDEKKNAWADLQQVMKVFGKEPKRS